MTQFRIVLAELPPLLEGILREAIARAPDMEVAAVVSTLAELVDLLRQSSPDVVVIMATDTNAASATRELRRRCPSLNMLAIAPTGDRAFVFGLGETPLVLHDVSATALLVAIRGA